MAITGSQKAYLYALSNVARSGASRSGYVSNTVFISIGGVPIIITGDPPNRKGMAYSSLQITDNLDEAANRCTFRLFHTVPTTGQEIILTMGSKNTLDRLFAGHVVETTQGYQGIPANAYTDVAAVDYTWQLGFALVTERYANLSATSIAESLVYLYGSQNGFSWNNVARDLPVLNEITFTNEPLVECLTRLVRRIGGYWYVDYQKDVHLFLEDTTRVAPTDLTPTHPTFNNFTHEIDSSQTLSRVYVEGRGTKVLTAVALGETRLPVEAVDMFEVAADVFVKVSFQGSDGGAQHLNYSGVVVGGQGALVGPGITPASAPTGNPIGGSGVTPGAHSYGYTWVTAAGETRASPVLNVTTGTIGDPLPTTPVYTGNHPTDSTNYYVIGRTYRWRYRFSAAATGNDLTADSGPSGTFSWVATRGPAGGSWANIPKFDFPYSTDPSVTFLHIYFEDVTLGGGFTAVAFTPNVVGIGSYHSTSSFSKGPTPEPAANPVVARVALANLAVGPATVTARKVYRTAVGSGILKLLTTLADNTTTTYTDAAADASLGANAPAADTSGLPQPTGAVLPYATSIVVSSTAAFDSAGGWVVIGNGEQIIRYTSIAGNSLLGIPSSGPGSVVAAVSYGATITAAPMLTGIPASGLRSLTRALVAGDELYLVVQVFGGAAQADLIAAVGGTGIREEWVQDRRLSIGEARARGQATLGVRPLGARRVAYTSRDLRTRSGQTITVNLPAPTNVTGAFKIQQVIISNFRPYPNQPPTYAVQASSVRFSFEDLLRSIKTKE